jgi:hypothetical protein
MIRIKLPAIGEQKVEQVFHQAFRRLELDIAPGSCFFSLIRLLL